MSNIERAISLLTDDNTCVLVSDEQILISKKKGIAPLIDYINGDINIAGFVAADRIIGKAAAYLFVYAGVKEVYGEVMSEKGIEVLEKYNIPYSYKIKTDVIINRKGDDICPMEKTVADINEPAKAYYALLEKTKSL